jgi:hypothetical protein
MVFLLLGRSTPEMDVFREDGLIKVWVALYHQDQGTAMLVWHGSPLQV